jgi:hypothetical protein
MMDDVPGKDRVLAIRGDEEDGGAWGMTWSGAQLQGVIDGVLTLPELRLPCLGDGNHAVLERADESGQALLVRGPGRLRQPVEVSLRRLEPPGCGWNRLDSSSCLLAEPLLW